MWASAIARAALSPLLPSVCLAPTGLDLALLTCLRTQDGFALLLRFSDAASICREPVICVIFHSTDDYYGLRGANLTTPNMRTRRTQLEG